MINMGIMLILAGNLSPLVLPICRIDPLNIPVGKMFYLNCLFETVLFEIVLFEIVLFEIVLFEIVLFEIILF